MKTKPIIPDPLTFLKAGISTMQQAAVLVYVGRTGLQGCRIDGVAAATRLDYNTVQSIAYRMLDNGLMTRYARSNKQGRAYYWTVTVKGWSTLTTAPDVDLFPDALTAPTQKGGKHE